MFYMFDVILKIIIAITEIVTLIKMVIVIAIVKKGKNLLQKIEIVFSL